MITIVLTVITLAFVLTFINSKLSPRTPQNNLIMFGVGAATGASIMVLMAYLMKFPSVSIAALYTVLGGLAFGAWLGYKPQILKAIKKPLKPISRG